MRCLYGSEWKWCKVSNEAGICSETSCLSEMSVRLIKQLFPLLYGCKPRRRFQYFFISCSMKRVCSLPESRCFFSIHECSASWSPMEWSFKHWNAAVGQLHFYKERVGSLPEETAVPRDSPCFCAYSGPYCSVLYWCLGDWNDIAPDTAFLCLQANRWGYLKRASASLLLLRWSVRWLPLAFLLFLFRVTFVV